MLRHNPAAGRNYDGPPASGLAQLPPEISRLTALTVLILMGHWRLEVLPETLITLTR